jgi:hypothetical protein
MLIGNSYKAFMIFSLLLLTHQAPAALAGVVFEPDIGGTVGKGDVQAVFRWNASATHANIRNVTFSYESIDTYNVVCTWNTANGVKGEKNHNVKVHTTTDVARNLRIEEGADGFQFITGFELGGFNGKAIISGKVPQVGEPCPGSDKQKSAVSRVELVEAVDRLYINHSGKKVQIWTLPK